MITGSTSFRCKSVFKEVAVKTKEITILLFLGLFLGSCSHLIDALWNPEASQFNLTVSKVGNDVYITVPRTDHSHIRNDINSNNDRYFWGYYVYRNAVSPYEDFILIGITGQVELVPGPNDQNSIWNRFVEKRGTSAGILDNNFTDPGKGPATYVDAGQCSGGTGKFYYRVGVVYREWDTKNKNWTSNVEDEAISSWSAVDCSLP